MTMLSVSWQGEGAEWEVNQETHVESICTCIYVHVCTCTHTTIQIQLSV